MNNDEPRNGEPRDDDSRDDADWLKDAFDRALRGDNGTAPDAKRPAASPFGGPATGETPRVEEQFQREELDLDFETDSSTPAGSFTPVADFADANSTGHEDSLDDNEPDPDPLAVFAARDEPETRIEELPTETIDVLEAPIDAETAPPTPTNGVDGLDALFGDEKFSEATTRVIPAEEPTVVVATVSDSSTKATVKPRPRFSVNAKAVRAVAFSVAGLILAVAGFVVGRVVSVPVAVPTPVETTAPPVPEIRDPGTYAWSELFGGECIDPYSSAWSEEFTVVACEEPHAAQLVAVGDFATLDLSAYPGDAEIGPLVSAECQKQGVLNLAAAGAYPNMEVSFAHAANLDDWEAGNTAFYCFVSLADGSDITGSVQAELVKE